MGVEQSDFTEPDGTEKNADCGPWSARLPVQPSYRNSRWAEGAKRSNMVRYRECQASGPMSKIAIRFSPIRNVLQLYNKRQ